VVVRCDIDGDGEKQARPLHALSRKDDKERGSERVRGPALLGSAGGSSEVGRREGEGEGQGREKDQGG
jgi:hypothetical protein